MLIVVYVILKQYDILNHEIDENKDNVKFILHI
jgi:hypothetical protein